MKVVLGVSDTEASRQSLWKVKSFGEGGKIIPEGKNKVKAKSLRQDTETLRRWDELRITKPCSK